MPLDFKAANAAILRDILSICRKYLPGGRQQGEWWLAKVPWRADKTPSLGVSLTTAIWKDFGRPGEHGDGVSLVSKLTQRTLADVVRQYVTGDGK